MDESGEGKAADDAAGNLAITSENVHRLMVQGAVLKLRMIEADMHRIYRRCVRWVWIGRGGVLLNVAVIALDAAREPSWVLFICPLNAWAAWYSFTNAERHAEKLPDMRWALVDVAEKIKLAEGIANESRA